MEVSLREAAKELRADYRVIKGVALALALEIRPTGTSLLLRRRDLDRIKHCLDKDPDAARRR